jgi:hypothetical protein
MSADIVEVLYRFQIMSWGAAEKLRAAIGEAQAVLDKLDEFGNDAEDLGQVAARVKGWSIGRQKPEWLTEGLKPGTYTLKVFDDGSANTAMLTPEPEVPFS